MADPNTLMEFFISDIEKAEDLVHRFKSPKVITSYKKDFMAVWTRRMAEAGAAMMRHLLSVEHEFRVGATGAASKNIEVVDDYPSSYVQEGAATPANTFIRRGMEPETHKVSYAVIKKWAHDKKISLKGKTVSSVVVVKPHVRDGHPVKGYYRSSPNKKKTTDRVIYAIMNSIYKYGSHREPDPANGIKGSHWNSLFPYNRGRFDYVQYTVKHRSSVFQDVSDWYGKNAALFIVSWLSGGQQRSELRDETFVANLDPKWTRTAKKIKSFAPPAFHTHINKLLQEAYESNNVVMGLPRIFGPDDMADE